MVVVAVPGSLLPCPRGPGAGLALRGTRTSNLT